MVEALRKCTALLSVLLLLTAFRCMANCIVSDTASEGNAGSVAVPPCHQHHAPPAPCHNHPGLQASAHFDVPVDLLPAIYDPSPLQRLASKFSPRGHAYNPPLLRTDSLSSVILQI